MQDCKELELAKLTHNFADIMQEMDLAKKCLADREKDLEIIQDNRISNRKEADNLLLDNKKLLNERDRLSPTIHDLDIQLAKNKKDLDDTLTLLNIKEKDLKNAKMGFTFAEEKNASSKTELYKLKKDNETLNNLLGKYRSDADFQKRLTEDEMRKRDEIAKEKKKIETEAALKSYEARKAKENLAKMQGSHELLLDSRYQLNQELDAMKQHADVLEYQNKNVNLFIFLIRLAA